MGAFDEDYHYFAQMEAALNALVGQVCWSVLVADDYTGSITLSLGERLARKTLLESSRLTPEQQQFTGAYELDVADCCWRLDAPNSIITSWTDHGDIKRQTLAYLVGQPIVAWEITWPGLDLTVHFAEQMVLRLFCDQTDPVEGGENYTLFSPELAFRVGRRSLLDAFPRSF
ncbi:MAG: hypothetical protein ACOYL5_05975 [Phototrophicaceae bacterium]|jgi:hypothetical protein